MVIGGSLTLYAYKGSQIRSRDNAERYSRESLLWLNNILLMTALCVVLLGTLLPLVHKQLGLGSISIGAPFFDQMFLIIMTPFALLLGIGPFGEMAPRPILRHSHAGDCQCDYHADCRVCLAVFITR